MATLQTACLIQNLSLEEQTRPLLSNQTFQLPYSVCSGLIGRNGQGKSLLMAALAGQLNPKMNPTVTLSGHIQWQCAHAYLPQLQRLSATTIAQALGIEKLATIFTRIQQGTAAINDYDLVEHQWHLPQQWQQMLQQAALPTDLTHPVAYLSEGQKTKLALCRLFLLTDHYLLLDEPSNHLDQPSRQWLIHAITRHPAGALIVSHDRTLLDHVHHILALNELGLQHYTGNYAHYKQQADLQTAALASSVEHKKRQLQQLRQQQLAAQAKAQKRQQAGKNARQSRSQAKIILDAAKERAGQTLAKLAEQQNRQLDNAKHQLRQEQQQLEHTKPQQFSFLHLDTSASIKTNATILQLSAIQLPFGNLDHLAPIHLSVHGGDHIHIAGANGCGKSTLLKVIHGELKAIAGHIHKSVQSLYLDQTFSFLDPNLSAVENLTNLTHLNPAYTEEQWRTLLGQLRLRRDKATVPLTQLSGGEQLKVALAAISHHQKQIRLLLLDEPENHLDIESRDILAHAIRHYPGAVLLVSHDQTFVEQCGIERVMRIENF